MPRHDWTRDEVRALHDLPFTELVFRAQSVHRLHFAPDEGHALFAALALAVPGHRILLVGTTRPGLDMEWVSEVERLDHCAQISLGRIGP